MMGHRQVDQAVFDTKPDEFAEIRLILPRTGALLFRAEVIAPMSAGGPKQRLGDVCYPAAVRG
jgi:hypothetical protein